MKLLVRKQMSTVFFLLTLLILFGTSNTGYAQAIDPPLSERTPQIRDAIVAEVPGVNAAADVTAAHLAAITSLSPGMTSLKAGDFNGLTALTSLNLSGASMGDIAGDIAVLEDLTTLTTLYLAGASISDISFLENLTTLTTLYLTANSITDISVLENLTALTELSLGENSVSDISALADLTNLTTLILEQNAISDISALENLTTLTLLALSHNSISDISILEDFTALTTLTVRSNPISDYGPLRRLKAAVEAAGSDIYIDVNIANNAPVFTDGTNATRSVAENTEAGQNIGTAVAATDADTSDELTYSLSGPDASSFSIVSTSGQLQIRAALDYETKSSYSVTVSVSDGNGGSNSIDVTINVTNVNEAPVFPQGTRATLSVAENTVSGTNIGAAFTAKDPDSGDTLTYSLRRGDRDAFQIDPNTGQLQTRAALDYETKSTYNNLAVRVTDSSGLIDAIVVTVNVTDVNEIDPPLSERTQQVREAIVAAVSDVYHANDVTPAHLAAITELYLLSEGITSLKSGDFSGLTALTELYLGNNAISDISALEDLTTLRDLDLDRNSISDISALEDLTALTELYLGNNAISDVSALEGLTALETLVLTENPISDYAPLRRLKAAIENAGNFISIDIDINNNPPQFTDGDSTTRSVSENMLPYTNIGTPVSATDADPEPTLYYSLGGPDADSFSINEDSGQLQTTSLLDYETQTSYSVTVSVSDQNEGSDRITVTINVTDVDETLITPVNQRTQQVRDAIVAAVLDVNNANDVTPAHLAVITSLDLSVTSITSLKSVDFSGLTALTELYLSGNSISDISALEDLTALTVLSLYNNSISDISTLEGLTAMKDLYLYNNSISDISALEDLIALIYLYLGNNSISDISALEDLTALTELYLGNNAISDVSALEGLTALETLVLSGNPISDYAPLRRLKTAIENAGNSISIDIDINNNNPPVFTDGDSTTRSVAENTEAGQNIGTAVEATDADTADTLTYSLGGTDADVFDIVSASGQLQTKAALDYENKTSYTVTVTVYDGNSGGDRITVTINVTDVINENAPAAPSIETPPIIPDRTALLTNFPNPFNPETWIPYQLTKPAEVTLTIYDIRGVVVRELKLGHQAAGFYQNRSQAIYWDGRNTFGEKVATGVYFYTLQAGDFTATRKLLIRK